MRVIAVLWCIPESKRIQAPFGAQVQAFTGLPPWNAPVPPTERAGSEGVMKYRGADRFPPNKRHPERKRRISVHGVSDSWGSKYQSAGRHQTYSIPESKRVQAPSVPGFKVQKVQRVVVAALPQIKKGRGSAAGCVEGLHPTGETTHYDLCVAGAPSNHVRCASLLLRGRQPYRAEGCGLPVGQCL